jgi:hypothetical protein
MLRQVVETFTRFRAACHRNFRTLCLSKSCQDFRARYIARDILRAVNGAASLAAGRRQRWELPFAHRRVLGVPRPRYSYPVGDSEVPWCFVSVSSPLPQGIPCKSRAGIPKLSDCPDMGAVMPPRFGVRTGDKQKHSPTLTRFTPGLQAGILSLLQDSQHQDVTRVLRYN